MGLSVLPHQSGPVHRQHHMEPLEGHIVDEHVVGPLEERGVHREYRDQALFGHARRHGNGVSLGNAHIKKALREAGGKLVQSCARLHGCRDGAHPGVLLGKPAQRLAEGGRKARLCLLHRLPGLNTEPAHAVKKIGILLRRCIPFSLCSSYMEQDRAFNLLCIAQKSCKSAHIVAVHRAQVGKAHVLKHAARQQDFLDRFFHLVGHVVNVLSAGDGAHQLAVALFEAQVLGLEPLVGQMV